MDSSYAIIEDSGTQIKVRSGDLIDVDLREIAAEQTTVTFDKVLAVGTGDGAVAKLGLPYLAGAKVVASIVGEGNGPKIVTLKYKRRKGSRKKIGHRQGYLRVKIDSISA
ncbi:MAG: 50S ribosomal protein L21 [Phycisphaerae bacterium]|nr:50S ribosomal protein L21 [Phycisphaerae bacterium]